MEHGFKNPQMTQTKVEILKIRKAEILKGRRAPAKDEFGHGYSRMEHGFKDPQIDADLRCFDLH
jgi:hypothetical protein